MSVAEPPPALRLEGRIPDELLYEVIDGEIVELPPMSVHANKVASRFVRKVGAFADDSDLGEVVGEVLFRLPLENDRYRNRRPDVAFVSYARWPKGTPEPYRDNAWDIVPDLAIEVVSPTDYADEVMEKVHEYLTAGIPAVWVVYPKARVVHQYESPTSVRAFAGGDLLDGGKVLPGLRLPLTELFVGQPDDGPEPPPAE